MKLVNGVTYTFCKRSLNFEPPVTPFNQLTWRLRHLVWNNSFMYQNVRTLFCCVCYHSLVYLCCVWANPCVKAQEEITRLTNATQTADPDPNFLVCNWYSSLIKLAIILKIRPRQCLYSHAVHATSLTWETCMLFCLILKWIFYIAQIEKPVSVFYRYDLDPKMWITRSDNYRLKESQLHWSASSQDGNCRV